MNENFRTYKLNPSELSSFEVPLLDKDSHYSRIKEQLSKSKHRCILLVDQNCKLINIITQGDLIRYEVSSKKHSFNNFLINKPPCQFALTASDAINIAKGQNYSAVPIKNLDGFLSGVVVKTSTGNEESLTRDEDQRFALIMAGGKGTRLRELTLKNPKPLIEVGERPLIEHIMSSIDYIGFKDFYLLCGYRSEAFYEYITTSQFNIKICEEDFPLGTGGPFVKWVKDHSKSLSRTLKQRNNVPILIANGDLLFDLDSDIYSNFERSGARFAIVGRKITSEIKYGTMNIDDKGKLLEFVEKPKIEKIVNTGVYFILMDNNIFEIITKQQLSFIGMPELLQTIAKTAGEEIFVIETAGNYLDLGTPEDFEKFKITIEG